MIKYLFYLNGNAMFILTINVINEKNQCLSADEIIQRLIQGSRNHPSLVVFNPEVALNKKTLRNLLTRFPKTCIGLKLSSFVTLDNNPASIEWFEILCKLLPPHLRIIDATRMIHFSLCSEFQHRFFKALPKTIDHLILCNNYLGYRSNQSQLHALLSLLEGVRILDLRLNDINNLENQKKLKSISYLPSSCDTVYTELWDAPNLNKHLLSTLPPGVKTLGIAGIDLAQLSSFQEHIPPSLTNLRLFSLTNDIHNTPQSIKTLDLTGCTLNSDTSFAKIPPHVTTLILDNLEFSYITVSQWVTLIKSIPSTVTNVSLKGNNIFHYRNRKQRDELLLKLQPYNSNGRLNLLDNGEDDWERAALPLIKGVNQKILPNLDCAYYISTFLGAKSYTLFSKLQKKQPLIPESHKVKDITNN